MAAETYPGSPTGQNVTLAIDGMAMRIKLQRPVGIGLIYCRIRFQCSLKLTEGPTVFGYELRSLNVSHKRGETTYAA
ncbi:hypothetical protein PTKU15_84400 [Paraburkholderia terrae]|nr:hypothetical protein PTKU15_84400 [Paraburkholderia terrae]